VPVDTEANNSIIFTLVSVNPLKSAASYCGASWVVQPEKNNKIGSSNFVKCELLAFM
jgi:hypothetical protein